MNEPQLHVFLYNVPPSFLSSELKFQLQEIAGCNVYGITRISEDCVKARVDNQEGKQKLLKQPIPMSFEGSQFHLRVESSCTDSDDDIFIYTPSIEDSRAIVRYLAHENDHLQNMRSELKHLGELSAVDVHIEVKQNKRAVSNGMEQKQWEEECEKCIEEFIGKNYLFWKYSPQKCSPADSKYLSSLNSKYKGKCFVRWYKNNSTLNVTGTNKNVNEVKQEVLSCMEPTDLQKNDKRRTGKTCEFDTKTILPAILKFVLKNSNHKKELKSCCGKMANVTIAKEEGHIKIDIKIHQESTSEKWCCQTVKEYFSRFRTETLKYDKMKLKDAHAKSCDLFSPDSIVFCQCFLETGTVNVTGLNENFMRRKEQIDREVECITEEEVLAVDVYISQEKCGLWPMTMKKVSNKVTITPCPSEPKIVFRGLRDDIKLAKEQLEKISENLVDKCVTGLTERQLEFLKSCEQSQKNSLSSGKNRLDALYEDFQIYDVHASLAFPNSEVHLICPSEDEWTKGNGILRNNISESSIELNDRQVSCLTGSVWKIVLENMKDIPTLINKQKNSKILSVVCHFSAVEEIKKKILNVINENVDKERFYNMPREKAEYIKRFCKPDHATPSVSDEGLTMTCSEEDIDAVDVWIEELQIVQETVKLSGYSLYEYLSGEGKPFVMTVENDTKCSVFLREQRKSNRNEMVKVVIGRIEDEKCDAIVNSTGRDINFSGQVSSSILGKYGATFRQLCQDKIQWLMKDRLCVTDTEGSGMEWKYIFHIMAPTEKMQMIEAISMLLKEADRYPIKSIALPTIGMGNLGLPALQVATCMKEAIEEFLSQQPSNLEEIKIVVFESQFLDDFQKIIPQEEPVSDEMSTILSAVIYGNDWQSVNQAVLKLEKVKEDHIKTATLSCADIQKIPSSLKDQIKKYCDDAKIRLQWINNGSTSQCVLEGITAKVHKVEEKVKELLHQDLPYNWTPMRDGETFEKVKLDETSTEYLDVKRLFLRSNPTHKHLHKIERIQNPFLYKQFKARRDLIKGDPSEITRELFHGTRGDKIEKICSSGFDRNFAGENGTAYGRGVYFAVNSQYSVSYTDRAASTKYMFLADVITGKYIQGNSNYKAAPEIGDTKVQYDSVVDNMAGPSIYVVFRDSSVYPKYLITFE